jgi:hypothetical protein
VADESALDELLHPRSWDSDGYSRVLTSARPELIVKARGECGAMRLELARLRAVIRETHTTYCTPSWTDRNLHAPECLLHEIEES